VLGEQIKAQERLAEQSSASLDAAIDAMRAKR
jgi:hypothetical protein